MNVSTPSRPGLPATAETERVGEREVHPLAVALAGVAWLQCLLILQVLKPLEDPVQTLLHLERLNPQAMIQKRFWSDPLALGHIALALNVTANVWLSLALLAAPPNRRSQQKLPLHFYEAVNWLGIVGMAAWLASFLALIEYYNVLLFLPVFFALLVAGITLCFFEVRYKTKVILPIIRAICAFRVFRIRAAVKEAWNPDSNDLG